MQSGGLGERCKRILVHYVVKTSTYHGIAQLPPPAGLHRIKNFAICPDPDPQIQLDPDPNPTTGEKLLFLYHNWKKLE